MALLLNTWTDKKTGVVVENAYVRISSILVAKLSDNIPSTGGWTITITTHTWNSEEDRQKESHPDNELTKTFLQSNWYHFYPKLEDGNLPKDLMTVSYDYLKTLPEYKNSEDV